MPSYAPDAVVTVYPFSRQNEGQDVIIGRREIGVFLSVPPDAVELLDWFAEGKSIEEVRRIYKEKYSEIPDLDDFVAMMAANGILTVAGENGPKAPQPETHSRMRYHLSHFPEKWARRVFSWPILGMGVLFVALGIAEMVRDPSLIPRQHDLYFSRHRTLTWTIVVIVSYATVGAHELAHMIAARARGINSRFGFGNRLWDLVMETDLSGLWSVPRRQRYLPLLAGSLLDAVSTSVLIFLLAALRRRWITVPDIMVQVMRAVLFTYVMRVLWQCFIFVRTDYYYVIANFLNCRNLLGDTEQFLRNQLSRVIPAVKRVDLSHISSSERRILPVYAVVWIGGRILAFIWLFSITIPLVSLYARNLGRALSAGFLTDPYNFVDSVLLGVYFILPISIGFLFWIRGLVRLRRGMRGTGHGIPEPRSM